MLVHPQFNPIAVQIGPLAVHWYGITYLVAFGLFLTLALTRSRREPYASLGWTRRDVEDLLFYGVIGVILGGRLGYVLFYQPSRFLAHPLEIFAVWTGGMSFHGGMLGMAAAIVLFCRKNRIPVLGFADRIATIAPVGLLLGRIANFINGELWGRPAPHWLPWAMIFPADPQLLPRHPSQLYQALLEGVVLLAVMLALAASERMRARFGALTGAFLCGYAVARCIGEFFRQPDPFLGFLFAGATMGQLLSVPMLLAGIALIAVAKRH